MILDGGRNESIGFGPKLDVMHASVNIDLTGAVKNGNSLDPRL
jgi:hypothetical protein